MLKRQTERFHAEGGMNMEKQIITITVVTEGEKCEMSDEQILEWYRSHVAGLFDPAYGTPQISVSLKRTEE